MSNGFVTYTLEENVAHLAMDDGKANALSYEMLDALNAALDRAEKEAAAVVLSGRSDRFCAGFDLKVMMSSPDAAKALLRKGGELYVRLYGAPYPVVVACTGHALAGGSLVLLTADVRIGAAGPYRIGLNEVQIGLPIPVMAMELARDRLVGTELGRATLEAKIYGPEEAARAGWLDEVVAPAEVVARAKAEAKRLGALTRSAYSATKSRLRGRTIEYVRATVDEDMRTLMAGAGL
jgi:enoyl-CoA hydratase